MSLPASQERALGGIESRLRAADPHLASMFAIFTRLNVGEPEPQAERLVTRLRLRWQRPRLTASALVLIPVMFIAMIVISALAGGPLGPKACVGNYALGGGSSPLARPACQLSGHTAAVKTVSVTLLTSPDGTQNPACIALVHQGPSARGWVCYK